MQPRPGMDVVTVLCKARGYIARREVSQTKEELEWSTVRQQR